MKMPVSFLLLKMAAVYQRAVRSVKARHGNPVREVRHHFTTTFYYLGPDGTEDLVVEIEPDPEAGEVRILAVQFNNGDDGQLLYCSTETI